MTEIGLPTFVTCINENQGKKKYPEQNAKLAWSGEICNVLNINTLTTFLLHVRETATNQRSLTSNTWRSRTISGVNKYRAPAFCAVGHVCGSSVRNMLHVTPGAQILKLAVRFLEHFCTPGVDSCQRDSCTKRFEGFSKRHGDCVLSMQFLRPHFSWCVIPFHVSQLTYLQGQTLGVMEIFFSTFCAGFATNVPSDEKLHAP